MFFFDSGVLCRFKVCSALNVRHKFKEAETNTRSLFDRCGHQTNNTGGGDEGNMPSYVTLFF